LTRQLNRSQWIRLKVWEFEKAWAGFGLTHALAFFVTQAMKNIFGKPRPNLLARCQPDLANVAEYAVGVYSTDVAGSWTLVTSDICTTQSRRMLNDGFRSFPSGHSSFSWAGMLYLTFFLCARFAIAIPRLRSHSTDPRASPRGSEDHHLLAPNGETRPSAEYEQEKRESEDASSPDNSTLASRDSAATPPNYLLIPAFVPIAIAVWVCSTRYVEFYHFGFDIISGSLIGILSAWFGYRWYHTPVRQGWAWGPRSPQRAFGIASGTDGYVEDKVKREDGAGSAV
jgi:membrane-associated phospholipid phosphatase